MIEIKQTEAHTEIKLNGDEKMLVAEAMLMMQTLYSAIKEEHFVAGEVMKMMLTEQVRHETFFDTSGMEREENV